MAVLTNALVYIFILRAFAEGTCGEYGVGEVSDCTEGFPSLFHIDNVLKNTELDTKDKRQVLIPGINFTCNGTVTTWIIGAEWKGNTQAYTELQIWRMSSDSQYEKITGVSIMVGTMNGNEVYEQDSPLAFQEGDILGYFQPKSGDSELDLYLEKSKRITTYYMELDLTPPANGTSFSLDEDISDDKYPLIAAITDPPDCGCGFMSMERVYALLTPQPTGDEKKFNNRQMIFPSITFNCAGEVVKWMMAGKWKNDRNKFPQLQIWRLSGGTTYVKQNNVTIEADDKEDDELYEYSLASPLPFQPGDILGVLQPDKDVSKLQLVYEKDGGDSMYYHTGASDNNNEFDIDDNGVMTKSDIPLVTVEIRKLVHTTVEHTEPHSTASLIGPSPSSRVLQTSSPLSSTPHEFPHSSLISSSLTSLSPSSAVLQTSPPLASTPNKIRGAPSSITSTATSHDREAVVTDTVGTSAHIVLPTTSSVPSESPTQPVNIQSAGSGGLASGAVTGLVLSLIIMLVLLSTTIAVIVFITFKRKRHMVKTEGICNPNYGDVTAVGAAKYTKNTESVEVYSNTYEDDLYAMPDNIAQHYETPAPKALETSQQWGVYVPTEYQRTIYEETDNIYSYPELKPVVRDGCGDESKGSFFTESDIYWVPASRPAELYEQLSKNHFREIQRGNIEIVEHLGSGQFGTVTRGVWQCPRGQQDVAIKLLKEGAPEDNRVKFLKEAAIMGQFSHPNIISLLGVVTLGEPVMIVMELMKNGDLRDNLINMRPIPGELAPQSLPRQLLDFCQQVSAGMAYLSKKAFVHRDIAARNILLSGMTCKTCKIADFGMSRDLEESAYYTSQGGQIPVKWTAPEAIHYKKYSTASDVWSFGCLMYEIWSLGHKPFEDYTNRQTVQMVMKGWRLVPPPGCPREIYSLMISCWHSEASRRPKFSSVLQTLSQSEHELLHIPEEVTRGHPQASVLGAPLEAGRSLYTELQNTYTVKE